MIASLLALPVSAQHPAAPVPPALEPVSTGGLETVERALAKLSTHRRLLVVGAHPDDEDNSLLALLGRIEGGEAGYLALSRGEGGQNLIGPELGIGLGVIRTGELLAARRIEGSRQFFARAFDFGYTRSLAETFARWPHESLLEDAVRVVRRFKPQVIVSVFPPDERARHGQHQASAVIAADAYEAAGMPDRYPRLSTAGLPPWRPQAFYRRTWWSESEATLSYSLGVVDPLSGRSALQLAGASRSQHRSQDMGRLLRMGPGEGRLGWVAGGAGRQGADPFAGIDTRLAAIAESLPAGGERTTLEAVLTAVEATARAARDRLGPGRLGEVVPDLARIVERLREGLAGVRRLETPEAQAVGSLVEEKLAVAEAALAAAAGVAVESTVDQELAAPGDQLAVAAMLWNSGQHRVVVEGLSLLSEESWRVAPESGGARQVAAGALEEWSFEVEVPQDAAPTLPYFLERPLQGDLYDWSGAAESVRGEPYQPPPLQARFELRIEDTPLRLEREVVHRYRDQAVGEVRRPLRLLPRLEVEVEPGLIVWPSSRTSPQTVEVTLTSHAAGPLVGRVALGWSPEEVEIPGRRFHIDEPSGRAVLRLPVERPPGAEAGRVRGVVSAVLDGGERFEAAMPLLDYPHIRPAPMRKAARVDIHFLDLELPRLERIGYVRGASDRVPEALQRVGLPVELVGPEQLGEGEFSRYDVIVVGARGYEVEPALTRAHPALLDWVRQGGLLIVQYHKYPFVDGGFAPYPLSIGRPHGRVTDEASPVRILAAEHPVFQTPNRISETDWQGWVQERGLYFAQTWDEAYQPLLVMHDAGRPEERGSLLVAELGAGRYVYTGLAFFRELPAGVPGAFRLFANLLALGE